MQMDVKIIQEFLPLATNGFSTDVTIHNIEGCNGDATGSN